jgi:hypothetical protein
MPVLRMPGDDTLGSTLGSMADAWGQAYDPMARARAAQMGQQMQLSRFELGQKQALDAVNANAAQVYLNLPHPNEDPGAVAAHAAAIRSGAVNPEQWANAAIGLTKLTANQAAAAAIDPGSPEFQGYSPADILSAKAATLNGVTLPTFRTQQAGATLDTAKTNQALTTANASTTPATPGTATTPGSDPATDALIKLAILSGQPAPDIMRTKAMEGIITGPTGTDPNNLNTRSNLITVATGQPPALNTPLVPGQAPAIVQRNTVADALKEAAIRATTPGRPGDVFRPFGQTAAGGFQVGGTIIIPGPGETAGAQVPQEPAAPGPTPPDQPPTPPVATKDASGNTVISPAIAGQTKLSEMQAEQYGKDLTEAREGGESADKLIPILSLASQLHAQLAASSPADQAWNQILQKIATVTGVAVNDKASALQAIGNLVARQMPDMREELHIRNFAGPEISAIKTMLADPALSDENFNLIMKTEMANAQVAQNRRDAALDAIRYGQAPKDYYDKEKQVFAPESNPMWKFFQANPDALSGGVKAYDPKQPFGPPAPPPAPKAPPLSDYRINPKTGATEKLVNGAYVPMGQ